MARVLGRTGAAGLVASILLGGLLLPGSAEAVGSLRPQIEQDPYFRGIDEQAEIVAWAAGDLSGDRLREVVVAFKETGSEVGTRGGIAVFASRQGRHRKVFGALWDGAYPREIRIVGRRLEVIVVAITEEGELPLEQDLVHGRDIVFDDRTGGLLQGIRVEASSTLRHFRAQTDPGAVLDGDLVTGWAEDGRGTGVGEWLRFTFENPAEISWMGMATGDHRSEEHRQRSNRVYRSEVAVRTSAEEGDPAAGVSFQALGLDFRGERIPVRLSDRMGMQYFEVDREDVRALEMRISSVYVGDRLDDTWVTEIDLFGRLPAPTPPSFVYSPLEGRRRD